MSSTACFDPIVFAASLNSTQLCSARLSRAWYFSGQARIILPRDTTQKTSSSLTSTEAAMTTP